ncbi:gp34.45 [Bacillus phage SPO1]|uniref:Gp34.45 n=1 Tax=Bacillus phage SP01 TaxID=2884427 RepID=B6V2Z9_BPSP1|nr:gp34.45 [Bacillus phage SPO1]ACI91081.1 gp34.45 [Bacillus phage SPO1]
MILNVFNTRSTAFRLVKQFKTILFVQKRRVNSDKIL